MTQKVEQWMKEAAEHILIEARWLIWDQALEVTAEIIASHAPSDERQCPTCKCTQVLPRGVFCTNKFHAPSEAALRQELAQLKAAYQKAIACVPTELLNLYFQGEK